MHPGGIGQARPVGLSIGQGDGAGAVGGQIVIRAEQVRVVGQVETGATTR